MKKSKKESFILYLDSRNLLDCLDYEKKGRLIEAIFAYVAGEEVPSLPPDVNMAFISIKTYLDKDRERYDRICEKRREYGKLGGLAKGSISNHMQASEADNDTDNDNDTDTDNDTDNDNVGYIYKNKPTMDEVRAEFKKRGLSEDEAKYFYYYYDAQGWVTSSGQKIQRLDSMVNRWISNNHKNKGDGKSNGSSREERMRGAARVMERIKARAEEENDDIKIWGLKSNI